MAVAILFCYFCNKRKSMTIKQAFNAFFKAVGKVTYALFYTFSAFTLVATIIIVIAIVMSFFKAGKTETFYMAYTVLALVGLYIVGKAYYLVASWKKRRLKAKEDALNEEMERGRNIPSPASSQQHQQTSRRYDGQQPPKRNLPPATPVKAGNTRW